MSNWWPNEEDSFRFEKSEDHVMDDRNLFKVEKWTKDGMKVDQLLYVGNNLEKARKLLADAIKHRPRIRLTIRQGTHVLEEWPNK